MSDLAAEGEARWALERIEDDLDQGRTVLGFQGWTHSPARLLGRTRLLDALGRLRASGSAVILQVSITGLGGSILEPGIRPTGEETDAIERLLGFLGLGWEALCLRIDPLQAYLRRDGTVLSNLEKAPRLLESLARLGARRFRSSALQFDRYRSKVEPRLRARGLRHLPLSREALRSASLAMAESATRAGAELRSCASALPGIEPGACFDPPWMRGLCDLPEAGEDRFWTAEKPVAPRTGCLCAHSRDARLFKIPRRSSCPGRCAACYAQL